MLRQNDILMGNSRPGCVVGLYHAIRTSTTVKFSGRNPKKILEEIQNIFKKRRNPKISGKNQKKNLWGKAALGVLWGYITAARRTCTTVSGGQLVHKEGCRQGI